VGRVGLQWRPLPVHGERRAVAVNFRYEYEIRRELYRTLELPGEHPQKTANERLDAAVRSAYGMSKSADSLEFILKLNGDVAQAEKDGNFVQGPGLPAFVKNRSTLISADCVRPI